MGWLCVVGVVGLIVFLLSRGLAQQTPINNNDARRVCTLADMISIPIGAMYLHARTFCTLSDMISVLIGEMFLHARMFCTPSDAMTIPMGLINVSTCAKVLYTCWYDLYNNCYNVFTCKDILYEYSLICSYSNLHDIFKLQIFICRHNLRTVIFFCGANFYPMGSLPPLFIVLLDGWPPAIWAIVRNNLTAVIEVVLIDVALLVGFLYMHYVNYIYIDSKTNYFMIMHKSPKQHIPNSISGSKFKLCIP